MKKIAILAASVCVGTVSYAFPVEEEAQFSQDFYRKKASFLPQQDRFKQKNPHHTARQKGNTQKFFQLEKALNAKGISILPVRIDHPIEEITQPIPQGILRSLLSSPAAGKTHYGKCHSRDHVKAGCGGGGGARFLDHTATRVVVEKDKN